MLGRLIGEHVDVETLLAPDLRRVLADPGQVEQVIVNLCVNARDAMPQGGMLTIETSNATLAAGDSRMPPDCQPGDYARLRVRDTGVGMDEETLARTFEPFFTTKGIGEGTGLGLATVYGIVRQSGGHIAVESRVGEGSTFSVFLPCARAGRDAGVAVEEPVLRRRRPSRGGETVLVVEDDKGVLNLARIVLQRDGYRVLTAADGEEGIAVAAGHDGSIDLLVSDVVMPKMSGKALADRLAAERPDLRILFLSGYTRGIIAEHGLLEGGTDLLEKPFSPASLASKVREILDRHPPAD